MNEKNHRMLAGALRELQGLGFLTCDMLAKTLIEDLGVIVPAALSGADAKVLDADNRCMCGPDERALCDECAEAFRNALRRIARKGEFANIYERRPQHFGTRREQPGGLLVPDDVVRQIKEPSSPPRMDVLSAVWEENEARRRDELARMILLKLLSRMTDDSTVPTDPKTWAKAAYEFADAMVEEGAKLK